MLEQTLSLETENNKLLKKIRGAQKRAATLRLIYWILIIGATLSAYFALKPYMEAVTNMYSQGSENIKAFTGVKLPTTEKIQELMNQFKQTP